MDVQLKEYVEAMIAAADRRYEDRFNAQEKAVNAALAAAEKAVATAETNAEKWRMNANEWRAAMNDRERQFLSKGMGLVVGALSTVSLIIVILQQIGHK
jgi:hypothetical protein